MKNIIKLKTIEQSDIHFELLDEKTNEIQELNFKHTNHSIIRSSQRGIDFAKISIALTYGQSYFKQGLNYFVLGEKDIPDFLSKEKSHYKNIVVVVAGDSNQVITCYKSKNPIKFIKHKSKELYKNYKLIA